MTALLEVVPAAHLLPKSFNLSFSALRRVTFASASRLSRSLVVFADGIRESTYEDLTRLRLLFSVLLGGMAAWRSTTRGRYDEDLLFLGAKRDPVLRRCPSTHVLLGRQDL